MQWQCHRGLSALEARKIFVVAVGLSRQHTLASCGDPPSDAIALGGSENGFSNSEWCKIVADEQFKLFGFGMKKTDLPTVPLKERLNCSVNPTVKNFQSSGNGVAFMPWFIQFKNAGRIFVDLAQPC